VSKTLAKSVSPSKSAAKKPAVAAKAPAKSARPSAKVAKPAAKVAPKAPAKPAATKATKPLPPAAKVAPARKPVAKPVDPAPVQAPAPVEMAVSRFADRFAPPKPPAKHFPESDMDTLKPAVKVDPKLANAWKSKSGRDLNEAELLAMPDSEYMNDKQLDFFRARLTALKDDLLSNAGETTEHLREDTSIVPDPADRATIEEEHALELRTRDRERKLLKKISQSLARIEAGDYGFCDETGEPIGLARLLARPTATLSLEAQQRRELKQKMFGD
jgi:DnaK suppressor protein